MIAVSAKGLYRMVVFFQVSTNQNHCATSGALDKNIGHVDLCPCATLTAEDGEDDVDVGEEEEEQALVTEEHW